MILNQALEKVEENSLSKQIEDYPIDSVLNNLRKKRAVEAVESKEINTQERPRLVQLSGRLLILLTLISFIFVGLFLNLLQLILCVTVRFSNNRQWRRWHKLMNGFIIYLIYTQPTFLIYFWTRVDMKIHLSNTQMVKDVRDEIMAIIIANHTYELDWLICFLMADHMGNIGAYKCFAKDELRWLPVIGWSFWMSDLIFVKRDWSSDKNDIERKLDELLFYDQILLGIFAEGTRITKEKYADALEFAKTRKLAPYKYHLFPRARGFVFTLRHYLLRADSKRILENKALRLFNLEIVLPDKPDFECFLNGSYIKADIYCEEIEISEDIRQEAINSKNADECPRAAKLLQDIYRRKDELVDEYQMSNGFQNLTKHQPKGGLYPQKKPYGILVFWSIFMLTTYGTFVYLANTIFAKSFGFWTFVVIILTGGMLMLRRIEKESKPNNVRLLTSKTESSSCRPKPA